MVRPSHRSWINATKSILLHPCSIHWMMGSSEKSCNGLASQNNYSNLCNPDIWPHWRTSPDLSGPSIVDTGNRRTIRPGCDGFEPGCRWPSGRSWCWCRHRAFKKKTKANHRLKVISQIALFFCEECLGDEKQYWTKSQNFRNAPTFQSMECYIFHQCKTLLLRAWALA